MRLVVVLCAQHRPPHLLRRQPAITTATASLRKPQNRSLSRLIGTSLKTATAWPDFLQGLKHFVTKMAADRAEAFARQLEGLAADQVCRHEVVRPSVLNALVPALCLRAEVPCLPHWMWGMHRQTSALQAEGDVDSDREASDSRLTFDVLCDDGRRQTRRRRSGSRTTSCWICCGAAPSRRALCLPPSCSHLPLVHDSLAHWAGDAEAGGTALLSVWPIGFHLWG